MKIEWWSEFGESFFLSFSILSQLYHIIEKFIH